MPSSLVMSEVSPANLAARGEGVEGAFAKDKDGPCGSSSSNGLPSSPPQSTSVHCRVSCRIPTDEFGPLRLLLYTNTLDKEEHTVIVFGEAITSASLEAVTGPHESEMDRLIRGALPLTTTTSSNSSITTATTSSTIAINNVITADAPHNNMDNMIENKGGSSSSATACYQRPPVLTRIHSACFTGETLCSARCDCAVNSNLHY